MTDSLPNMPYARLSRTKAVVEAAVLRQKVLDRDDPTTFKDIQAERYICLDCDAEVRPKCMELGKQFIPFFFLRSKIKDPHRPSCNVRKCEEALKDKDKPKNKEPKLSSTNKVLIKGYPNRLVLDFFRLDTQDGEENDSSPDIGSSSSPPVSLKNDSNITKDWAVTSISPLVKQYLKEDERNFRLVIPGVDVNTYEKVFYKISFLNHYELYRTRIYYGQVIYTAIEKNNNLIRFYLTDGNAEKNLEGQWRLSKKSSFEINLDLCREVNKKEFIKKISELKKNAEEYKRTGQLLQGRFCAWIFFLGYSLDGNNTKFSLYHDSPHLIEFCITDTLNNIKSVAYHSEKSSQNTKENITEEVQLNTQVSDSLKNNQTDDPLEKLEKPQLDIPDIENINFNSLKDLELPQDECASTDENPITETTSVSSNSVYAFLGPELTAEDLLAQNDVSKSKNINPVSSAEFLNTNSAPKASQEKIYSKNLYTSLRQKVKKAFKVPSRKEVKRLIQAAQSYTQKFISIASDISLKSNWINKSFKKAISFLRRK